MTRRPTRSDQVVRKQIVRDQANRKRGEATKDALMHVRQFNPIPLVQLREILTNDKAGDAHRLARSHFGAPERCEANDGKSFEQMNCAIKTGVLSSA